MLRLTSLRMCTRAAPWPRDRLTLAREIAGIRGFMPTEVSSMGFPLLGLARLASACRGSPCQERPGCDPGNAPRSYGASWRRMKTVRWPAIVVALGLIVADLTVSP